MAQLVPAGLSVPACVLRICTCGEQQQAKQIRSGAKRGLSHRGTTSQLVRSVFQSTMGSYEGAFSAEPAAGDHRPRGGLGGAGGAVVGSPTHPAMPNLVVLWEMGPLRREVRAGARSWTRVGPRPPGLGRNWAQTEARGGWWARGPAAGCGERRRGQPGPLIKH
jgi:hypothetical protein